MRNRVVMVMALLGCCGSWAAAKDGPVCTKGPSFMAFNARSDTLKHCHMVCLSGPTAAVEAYQKRQKERFEPVAAPEVERLRQTVLISVSESVGGMEITEGSCLAQPQKIVLADGETPLLTIPIKAEPYQLQNKMGATLTAYRGNGEVPTAEVRKLLGRQLKMHVIFNTSIQHEDWEDDWAEKLLRQ